jgi:hypothetical protein
MGLMSGWMSGFNDLAAVVRAGRFRVTGMRERSRHDARNTNSPTVRCHRLHAGQGWNCDRQRERAPALDGARVIPDAVLGPWLLAHREATSGAAVYWPQPRDANGTVQPPLRPSL